MFLTRRTRSRTLRLTLGRSKSAGTLRPAQKWNEQHPSCKSGKLHRCRSQDNRAYYIGALCEKIIACSRPNSNDFAAKIALMSVAVILPSHLRPFMERITIV